MVSRLFLLLASCQGIPKLPKGLGSGPPAGACVPVGAQPRPRRSLGPASLSRHGAHSEGCGGREVAAAGRLRAERKPRAQTGRGGWDQPLLQPAVNEDPTLRGSWGGSGERTASSSAPPTPTPPQPRRDLHVAGLRIPLPSRPCIEASHNPQPQQSQLCAPGRGILLTLRAGVARQQLLCTRPFPPTPTSLGSLWRSWWGCNSYLQVKVDICSRVLGSRGRGCWEKWVIGQEGPPLRPQLTQS
ncbi:uncharacterized protein LOC130681248 [Manis pentadactyla]|uniref:uncharacterized protein LOC130681248 n=1 Tax=Manis pentadactyla TaxID=143292 RepID=UPI00255C385B|nr:uncharacterized protein LOC130681248 [Manis pentadactyla]